MAQGSGALLPRLDGMAVEHRVAGEDHRVISLARTLTELEIAEVSDREGSPSKYVLSTLKVGSPAMVGSRSRLSSRSRLRSATLRTVTPTRTSIRDGYISPSIRSRPATS